MFQMEMQASTQLEFESWKTMKILTTRKDAQVDVELQCHYCEFILLFSYFSFCVQLKFPDDAIYGSANNEFLHVAKNKKIFHWKNAAT